MPGVWSIIVGDTYTIGTVYVIQDDGFLPEGLSAALHLFTSANVFLGTIGNAVSDVNGVLTWEVDFVGQTPGTGYYVKADDGGGGIDTSPTFTLIAAPPLPSVSLTPAKATYTVGEAILVTINDGGGVNSNVFLVDNLGGETLLGATPTAFATTAPAVGTGYRYRIVAGDASFEAFSATFDTIAAVASATPPQSTIMFGFGLAF